MKETDHYKLVPAKEDNYDDYYDIRKERKNMFWTGYEKAPDYHTFRNWYDERLKDKNRDIYLLFVNNKCAGALHIDFIKDFASIGYNVKERYQGMGIGTYMVKKALKIAISEKKKRKLTYVQAWINERNIASKRVIEKNDFSLSDRTEERIRFGEKAIFKEYIKQI